MSAHVERTRYAGTAIQRSSLVMGIVFLLLGVAGFVPGATEHADSIAFAGPSSPAMLFGVFQVSVLHNLVHLLTGVIGVLTALSPRASRVFLTWGAVVYAILWIYGLFLAHIPGWNFAPMNAADNWLHLGLAVVLAFLGLLVGRTRADLGPEVQVEH